MIEMGGRGILYHQAKGYTEMGRALEVVGITKLGLLGIGRR